MNFMSHADIPSVWGRTQKDHRCHNNVDDLFIIILFSQYLYIRISILSGYNPVILQLRKRL